MKDPIQISERELLVLTSDLDQMHNDLFPKFTALLDEINDNTRVAFAKIRGIALRDASRRNFLAGGLVTAGALGGGVLLSACGSSDTTSPTAAATPTANATDLVVAQLAASLEVLAINTYDTALKAAASGALGTVPAAVGQFATTAKKQHGDHRDAWNAALKAAGKPEQTAPDPKLNPTIQTALGGVKTITDLATLALQLETVAVETYTAGAGLVTDAGARELALTIAPVEAQHVAILNFVLGTYPVPDGFIKTDQARGPSDLG